MPELLLTRSKDYVYHDSDNPFRPEGDLAKEAEEFVHQLKVKEEQTVAEILNTKTSGSSIQATEAPAPPETTTQSPAKSENTAPKSSDNASNVAVVTPTEQESPSPMKVEEAAKPLVENGTEKPKKIKTKSKCGCSIS